MQKRVSTNTDNQLVLDGEALEGGFSIDENNDLNFKAIVSSKKFKGNWKLDSNHNLILTLSDGNSLRLSGRIIAAEKELFVFSITSRKRQGAEKISLIKLTGFWQADAYNRLSFSVKKADGSTDTLTLEVAWQIDNNQQVIYRYERRDLIRKTKQTEAIIFQGFWLINEKNKLRYILEKGVSEFDFRAQLESPKFLGKKGEIRYRLGVGFKSSKGFREETFSLFGAWKFGRQAGLSFAVDYKGSNTAAITFGANVYLGKKDEVGFELKNNLGSDLGMSVTFKRKILSGVAFLKLKKLEEEYGIDSGIRIPW